MKTSTIVVIILAVIVILGGWYAYATYYSPASTPSTGTVINSNPGGTDYNPAGTPGTSTSTATSTASSTPSTSGAAMTATVTLTADGFTPKSVTIKKGGTVTWKNASTGQMWVGSANHPTHTVYDGTTLQQHCTSTGSDSFDQCKNGATYSFTFDKVGSWNYHNHSKASQFGTVVVVE